jgi:hypothetical protein
MLAEKRRESRSFQEHEMLGNLKPAPGILGVEVIDAIAFFLLKRIDQRNEISKAKIKERAVSSRFS